MTVGRKLKSLICLPLGRALRSRTCVRLRIVQSFAEQIQIPDFIDPIEDFTEEDSISESMAVTGRSPKHPRTESEDNVMDVGALLEKSADRFSMSMEAKIESMMEQMDKRIEDKS